MIFFCGFYEMNGKQVNSSIKLMKFVIQYTLWCAKHGECSKINPVSCAAYVLAPVMMFCERLHLMVTPIDL